LNSDELIGYQRKMVKDNPVFPVRVEDYDKLNEFVISVKGLEQITILKRLTLMGNATLEDKVLLERLLEAYASANPSKERQREWKRHVDWYFSDLMKSRYNPDLIQEGLVVKNENFNPKYREYWNIWTRTIVSKIYALQREEKMSTSMSR